MCSCRMSKQMRYCNLCWIIKTVVLALPGIILSGQQSQYTGESLEFYVTPAEFIKLMCDDSPSQYYIIPNIPELIEVAKGYLADAEEELEYTNFKIEPANNARWRDVDKDILPQIKSFWSKI